MRYLKCSIILFWMLTLLGCSAISKLDKSDAYLKSSSRDETLLLPKDINSNAFENYYPIPKGGDANGPINASTLPPGSKIKD